MHEVWVKLGCCTEHFQKPCNRPWLQCQAGIAWLQVVYTHAPEGQLAIIDGELLLRKAFISST